MNCNYHDELAEEHRQWLSKYDEQYLVNWEKLLNNDSEAAMSEAAIRRIIQLEGNDVQPNEDLHGNKQAPDFCCIHNGNIFYVEATHIPKDKVTTITNLTPFPTIGGYYGLLNEAIFIACKKKTPQCSSINHPCLIAISVDHFQASGLCVQKHNLEWLLTGTQSLAIVIDVEKGEVINEPYEATSLDKAAFLRPNYDKIETARLPISGIIVCGIGCIPPQIFGVLHADPIHVFDRKFLPGIEFCRLCDGYQSGDLSTEWI